MLPICVENRDYDDDYDDDRPRRRRARADDPDTESIPSGWDASGWFSGAQQANQGGLFEWARRCGRYFISREDGREADSLLTGGVLVLPLYLLCHEVPVTVAQ